MAALWKLVLHSYVTSDPLGNEFLNVFGYRSNLPVINEEVELRNAFLSQIVPDIAATLHSDTKFTRLEVYNVTDGVGYLDTTINPVISGSQSGNLLPKFNAWSFKYQRASIGKRSGGKRFGQISEDNQDNGMPTGGMVAQLAALADTLGSPLTLGPDQIWFPEILERKPAGVFPWTSHPIAGVVFQRIGTQNTRKR